MTNLDKLKTLSDDKIVRVITSLCCETCNIKCGSKECDNDNCEK